MSLAKSRMLIFLSAARWNWQCRLLDFWISTSGVNAMSIALALFHLSPPTGDEQSPAGACSDMNWVSNTTSSLSLNATSIAFTVRSA